MLKQHVFATLIFPTRELILVTGMPFRLETFSDDEMTDLMNDTKCVKGGTSVYHKQYFCLPYCGLLNRIEYVTQVKYSTEICNTSYIVDRKPKKSNANQTKWYRNKI